MKKVKQINWICLFSICFFACVNENIQMIVPRTVIPKTVNYKVFKGNDFQGVFKIGTLRMDIYPDPRDQIEPSLKKITNISQLKSQIPLLIVHGGGWVLGGTLSQVFGNWLTLLQDERFRVFSIEHRTGGCGELGENAAYQFFADTPEITRCWKFPNQLEDIRDAIVYIKRNADNLNIDAEKLMIIADSSGAHLSMLHAFHSSSPLEAMPLCKAVYAKLNFAKNLMMPMDPESQPLCDSSVSGVASFFAPLDFEAIENSKPENLALILPLIADQKFTGANLIGLIKKWRSGVSLNKEENEIMQRYDQANPSKWLHSKIPRLFLSHSKYDQLAPFESHLSFVERLKAMGIVPTVANFIEVPGGILPSPTFIQNVPDYFPHTYLWALASHGALFYEKEIGENEKSKVLCPAKIKNLAARIFKVPRPKKRKFDLLKEISTHLNIDQQLGSIDRQLRQWLEPSTASRSMPLSCHWLPLKQ